MTASAYWWKLLGWPAVVVLVVYLLAVLAAWTMVDRALYYPAIASGRTPAQAKTIRAASGEIAVRHLPNPAARFTIWFFHGNAEDLGDLEPFLLTLRDHGYAVLAWDYPGYGSSRGRPSESSIYTAARIVRAHLRDELHVSAERMLIYGRSVGTGPAVQMAMEEPPAGLVLQSPFVSVYRVMTHWPVLPFDQFTNLRKIGAVRAPVLVLHGRRDEVIPFWHGEAVHAAAREPKRALWVDAAQHNDFLETAGAPYWTALREFSELCARGGSSP